MYLVLAHTHSLGSLSASIASLSANLCKLVPLCRLLSVIIALARFWAFPNIRQPAGSHLLCVFDVYPNECLTNMTCQSKLLPQTYNTAKKAL